MTACPTRRWDEWDEKIHGDSETRNWFMANTKPCPKCSKPVEKNGGCNLVMCKCGQVRTAKVQVMTWARGCLGSLDSVPGALLRVMAPQAALIR